MGSGWASGRSGPKSPGVSGQPPPESPRDIQARSVWRGEIPKASSRAMKLLLIEDEDRLAAALSLGLSEEGHRVDRAATGKAGGSSDSPGLMTSSCSTGRCPTWTACRCCASGGDEGSGRGALPHGAGVDRGEGPGSWLRGRRLPREAIRLRRAPRAARGAAPSLGRWERHLGRRCSRSLALRAREGSSGGVAHCARIRTPGCTLGLPGGGAVAIQYWARSGREGFDGTANVVDVYVGYLRTKLGRLGALARIESVRGVGYRLSVREA